MIRWITNQINKLNNVLKLSLIKIPGPNFNKTTCAMAIILP